MKKITPKLVLVFSFVLANSFYLSAQSVSVGSGSYSTTLPSGAVGPKNFSGANLLPKVSPAFNKPVQTNDFWSSLIFPFYGDQFSNNLFAHPLNYKAKSNGLAAGYTPTSVLAASDYLFPFYQQLLIGVDGLNATKATTDDYGDWTVTAFWDDGSRTMKATFGHGLPFVFLTISGGDASITCNTSPTVWYNQKGVLGLTVDGRHYGVFAPDSSSWTGTTTLKSSLHGKNYFSVALLPDNTTQTLEFFRKHAYAFVTDSKVSWNYDESSAVLTSTFSYITELKESVNENLNQTLSALYRHQWLNTSDPLTAYEYKSPRGKMKVFDGNEFATHLTFSGVLPSLPDEGDYNRTELLNMLSTEASKNLTTGPSYENGKQIAKFAHLVRIADQIGATTQRDHFISEIKKRLEGWLTVGGTEEYSYNSSWNVMTGYPSGYGADNQINDHNFHSAYMIISAAIVAEYDSVWASNSNWGSMINLLIKDSNNWDRTDSKFPFLRSMDPYAGHSWAAGHGDFGDGNNQESSSESMNFATAVILWGAATHQKEIRDLGIYLHATENSAVDQYWFDVDDVTFPSDYPKKALGMVWGAKGVHSTWFGADPEFIHGINILPLTGGSLYLGKHPDYVQTNYDEVVQERSGQPTVWKDIMWEYLALTDPQTALGYFYANPGYEIFDGETKAHTYHWIYNLKKIGHVDVSVTADIPTYSVFKNKNDEKTYVAYNPESDSIDVHFSDSFVMKVPPRSMKSVNTSASNKNAPVAIVIVDKVKGKVPLSVSFTGSKSFDPNNSDISYSWDFANGITSTKADTTLIYTEPGKYSVTLNVTNHENLTSSESVEIEVLGNGTPFSGTAISIPGIIQAENFDNGGEGVAYHDKEAQNIGQAFRTSDGVDLENADGGGYDVYWMTDGEWIEYTFQVANDGNFDITPFVSTVPGFGKFRLLIDNVDVSGKKSVVNTGGWQIWKGIPITNVSIKSGTHILRIEISSDSDKTGWLFSLNYFEIKLSGSVSVAENELLPKEFLLEPNFPNPFNPTTVIRYQLPNSGFVELKVFDILGREINTLVSKEQTTGKYQIEFNAASLPSGIYFARLKSNHETLFRKLTLVK